MESCEQERVLAGLFGFFFFFCHDARGWKHQVLTTLPPGDSQLIIFLIKDLEEKVYSENSI